MANTAGSDFATVSFVTISRKNKLIEVVSVAKTTYCWRCKIDVPMLDEQEWEQVLPQLQAGIEQIRKIRQADGAGLHEAKGRVYGQGALQRYYEITGFRETNINALWHHRLSQYGPPCSSCGKPLRTPRAKFCVACGTQVDGERGRA